MPFLKWLAPDDHAAHVFARYPHIYKLYSMASRAIMRGPSPFSPGQRELIGAYVSGLNRCGFCFGAHSQTAHLFGYPEGVVEQLLENVEEAKIEDNLKPVLLFIRKLVQDPNRLTTNDAEAVYAAGWDGDALHSAVAVASTFQFMNCFARGVGIETENMDFEALGAERHRTDYTPMAPIETEKISKDTDEAYALSPPNWNRIWDMAAEETKLKKSDQ
ncbi:MAG: peroxidase [Pseudomonadota bacterium]